MPRIDVASPNLIDAGLDGEMPNDATGRATKIENRYWSYVVTFRSIHDFQIDQIEGKDRVINFLPYPGNYGFIPGTLSNSNQGGDGDALDIIVLSSSIASKTVLEVIPIGVLKLIDNKEEDFKIIAIPYDTSIQTINATTFSQLTSKYKGVLDIIELWFLNYNPKDPALSLGWGDEKEAFKMIQKNIPKKKH